VSPASAVGLRNLCQIEIEANRQQFLIAVGFRSKQKGYTRQLLVGFLRRAESAMRESICAVGASKGTYKPRIIGCPRT
jgi:hypothetical protein